MKTTKFLSLAIAIVFCAALVAHADGGKITGKVTGFKKNKDFVVYVDGLSGNFKAPEKHPVMDQKGMEFVPHVLPVVKGTAVDFLNSDAVAHNVFSPDHEKFNLGTWPQGDIRNYLFDKELGSYTLLCNVHPEMEAFILVLSNPYFAVTGDDGDFEITGLPDGDYTLTTWHEKYKPMTAKVTVKDGKAEPVTLQK